MADYGFAGENFGFTLPYTNREGREATQSVLAQYFPELKLTFAPKDRRGGRLGRTSSQVTREVTMTPGAQVSDGAKKLLSEYIGPQGTTGILGLEGLNKARASGYTDADIKKMATTEGLKFGAEAGKSLGLGSLQTYTGPLATAGALGLTAVQNARAAGLSDAAIRDLAFQQNLKFGPEAAKAVQAKESEFYKTPSAPVASLSAGVWTGAPSASYNPKGSLNQFVDAQGTAGALGENAIKRALASGLNKTQILTQAKEQGISFGPKAVQLLNTMT